MKIVKINPEQKNLDLKDVLPNQTYNDMLKYLKDLNLVSKEDLAKEFFFLYEEKNKVITLQYNKTRYDLPRECYDSFVAYHYVVTLLADFLDTSLQGYDGGKPDESESEKNKNK